MLEQPEDVRNGRAQKLMQSFHTEERNMSRPCSVYGCASNRHGTGSITTYSLPKSDILKSLWLRHIPPYTPNPVVCSRHFSESSFLSPDKVAINGDGLMLFRRGPRKLKPDAVPTIFPDDTSYVNRDHTTIEQILYGDNYNSDRFWQGGGANVVMPQQPGQGSSLDMVPASSSPPQGLIANTPLRAPPMSGFIPISDQIRARSNTYLNMYGYQSKLMTMNNQPAPVPTQPMLPVLTPDVKFKRLPFYDLLGELLKPSTLTINNTTNREPTCAFVFFLTPRQASDISMNREVGPGTRNEYNVQVQLRFAVMDTTADQEDCFPLACNVKVNGKVLNLPNPPATPKSDRRPAKPVNISHLCKLCPSVANNLTIAWTPEYPRHYVAAVNLVRKLNANDLLERLKKKGARHPDYTTGLIKDKLSDSDNDIATTVLRVSLSCPLGKMRMKTACRAATCIHLQCFDAGVFLSMNEKRPTWTCPVCNKPAIYDNLVIDGYFQEVLESPLLGSETTEISFNKDGSWSCHDKTKEAITSLTPVKVDCSVSVDSPKADQVQEINDDDDDDAAPVENGESRSSNHCDKAAEPPKEKAQDLVLVDLTATDDEDDHPPPPPPPAAPKEVVAPPSIMPPIASKLDQVFSDSSSNLSTTRSPPSIINLDSPSPSPPLQGYGLGLTTGVVQPPSSYMCHMRLAPDSRYHPY